MSMPEHQDEVMWCDICDRNTPHSVNSEHTRAACLDCGTEKILLRTWDGYLAVSIVRETHGGPEKNT